MFTPVMLLFPVSRQIYTSVQCLLTQLISKTLSSNWPVFYKIRNAPTKSLRKWIETKKPSRAETSWMSVCVPQGGGRELQNWVLFLRRVISKVKHPSQETGAKSPKGKRRKKIHTWDSPWCSNLTDLSMVLKRKIQTQHGVTSARPRHLAVT